MKVQESFDPSAHLALLTFNNVTCSYVKQVRRGDLHPQRAMPNPGMQLQICRALAYRNHFLHQDRLPFVAPVLSGRDFDNGTC